MMDLERLSEALERHGLTVPAQKRRGLKTYEGEDGELLRADDAGLIRTAARAYRDLANGERVEPDYEAAAKVLADNDGIEILEWHEDLSRRVVKAAIGDKLLIDPPTEED